MYHNFGITILTEFAQMTQQKNKDTIRLKTDYEQSCVPHTAENGVLAIRQSCFARLDKAYMHEYDLAPLPTCSSAQIKSKAAGLISLL